MLAMKLQRGALHLIMSDDTPNSLHLVMSELKEYVLGNEVHYISLWVIKRLNSLHLVINELITQNNM